VTWTAVISVAAVFSWLGLVAGISLLEAPLKFRAPGITLALGLGIGRLVFAAMGRAEVALLAVTAACAAWVPGPPGGRAGLIAALAAILAVQYLLLRPALDRRAAVIIAGGQPPRSSLHLGYIAAECAKLIVLLALGLLLARGAA
jgi:hypothetical protein